MEKSHTPFFDIAPPEASPKFQELYDALDGYAYSLSGKSWIDGKILTVMNSKTVRYAVEQNYPEEELSANDDQDDINFGVVEYGFEAIKFPTRVHNEPFYNQFELSIADSSPVVFPELNLEHLRALTRTVFITYPEVFLGRHQQDY